MTMQISLGRKPRPFDASAPPHTEEMAAAAGIYHYLWAPDDLGIVKGQQLIEPLERGLESLRSDRTGYDARDARYEYLVAHVEIYLLLCRENPDADIKVSR
jgi:hypothetical protein